MTALALLPLRPFPGSDAGVRHERLSLGLCAGAAEACAGAGRPSPRAHRQPRRAHHCGRLACARVRLDGRRLERRARSRVRSARCSPTPPSAEPGRCISFSPRRWSRSSPSARAPDGRRRRSRQRRCWRASASSAMPRCRRGAEGVLHRANHAVHLMTAGAWIGGLVPFAMCLRAYERDDLRKDAVRAMAGFSFWGQFIVAAIVLTGVVNIALTSGRAPIPPTTPYRALLLGENHHRRDHDPHSRSSIALFSRRDSRRAPRRLRPCARPARRKSRSAASSWLSSACLRCSIRRETQ